ncbi:MAG: hypothetical protein MJ252_30150, partial [archaeon]|nr:hypothetical protein [archaeon]
MIISKKGSEIKKFVVKEKGENIRKINSILQLNMFMLNEKLLQFVDAEIEKSKQEEKKEESKNDEIEKESKPKRRKRFREEEVLSETFIALKEQIDKTKNKKEDTNEKEKYKTVEEQLKDEEPEKEKELPVYEPSKQTDFCIENKEKELPEYEPQKQTDFCIEKQQKENEDEILPKVKELLGFKTMAIDLPEPANEEEENK